MTIAEAFAQRAIRESSEQARLPLVRGHVFPIRLVPDTIAGDCFNIGVVFVDGAQVAHCQIAPDLSRLRCLYDDRVDIDSFHMLRDIVHAELGGTLWNEGQRTPSSNIEYGPLMPAAGLSVDEILQRTFATLVPFGAAHPSIARQTPILNDKLQKRVVLGVVEKVGAEAARYISREPIRLASAGVAKRSIRLPIHNRLNGAAADIVSAWSRHRSTIANNVLRSVNNMLGLRYAERSAEQVRQLGLFVLQPETIGHGFSDADLGDIHGWVDDLVGIAEAADVEVRRLPTEVAMIDAVANWAPLRRAA